MGFVFEKLEATTTTKTQIGGDGSFGGGRVLLRVVHWLWSYGFEVCLSMFGQHSIMWFGDACSDQF